MWNIIGKGNLRKNHKHDFSGGRFSERKKQGIAEKRGSNYEILDYTGFLLYYKLLYVTF